MELNTPSLHSLARLVEEQGLVVVDFNQMLPTNEPIIIPYVIIALNRTSVLTIPVTIFLSLLIA